MSKKAVKKMVQWIFGIGLGIAIATGAFLLYRVNQNKNDLAQYIRAHPDSTAVVAFTVDENGQPVADGSEVFFNADAPLVLASTMKTVVVAAYEAAVEFGELDPNELVSIADVEQFYLPKTDGGSHAAGLLKLGQATDADGFVKDPSANISLDNIARIVIHNSGNAETDYLLSRLTEERIAATLKAAGFEQHSPFHSILGISLAMMNYESPLTDASRRQALVAEVTSGNFSALEHLADLYLHDPTWRSAQLAFIKSDAFIAVANEMGWEGQVECSGLFPKSTAREYAHLMAQIVSGQLISPVVSARLQQKLETAPADDPMRLMFHQRYGSKDGVTAGVMNLVSYSQPKGKAWVGKNRVVVVLCNDLPAEMWVSAMKYQSLYLLQADLARGKGL